MRKAALIGLSVLFAGCATPAPSCGDENAAWAVLDNIIAADNARDLDAVMQFYTEEVRWRPPRRGPLRGAGAIRESYVAMYAAFDPRLDVVRDAVRVRGGRAFVSGRTRGMLGPRNSDGAAINVNDRFRATLRCESGRWLVHELAWAAA